MNNLGQRLPELPLDAWEKTNHTLHLFMQIVGKIRLKSTPRKNHWWFVTLYISPKGFTTDAIPFDDGFETFKIIFNLIEHQVEVITSRGQTGKIKLVDGLSVADFYRDLLAMLYSFGIEVTILDKSFDIPGIEDAPFSSMHEFATYQKDYVHKFWRIMMWVDGVFKEFSGRSYSKTSPVHLYWHHLDLAVTRFSGRKGPPLTPGMRISDKDAYSHEVVSFGFWAGDPQVRTPAFYSYTYPSPEGLDKEPLQPQAAQWMDSNGSPSATLMYDDLRQEDDPRQALLDFMESAYQGGARLSGWDIEALTVPPLEDL